MITPLLNRALWMLALVLLPVSAGATDASPAKPALTDAQLAEGLRSGLTTFSNQVLVAGAIKVPTPPLFIQTKAKLESVGKADLLTRFESSLDSAVKKLEPKVADEIRKALKTVKFEEPQKILAGEKKAATEFFRKAALSSLNDAVLPLIRKEITDADLTGKCRALVAIVDPAYAQGGNRLIVDLDYMIRKQMLDQSFALLAKQEAAARANPALLNGNTMAQMVFVTAKK